MNKFLKWILLTVGFVAFIVVIAAVVLPMVIDPNNYKQEISDAVYKQTGRELIIGGDIRWTVFPSLGLGLSDVTLGNRDGSGDGPMFDIGEADISVKLIPLLSKRIEIGQVTLSDVSIKLKRKADGESNLQDMGQEGDSSGESNLQDVGQEGDSSASTSQADFSISGAEISNAYVTLESAGQTTEIKDFDLKESNIELGQPFVLKGGFTVNLTDEALAGDVKFAGFIQTAANGKRFGIEGLDVSFEGDRGEGKERVPLNANFSADADIDLTMDTAVLKNFNFKLYDLVVTGDLDVSSLTKQPAFKGKLKVAEFNPKSFIKAMGMEEPKTRNNSALTRLQADMRFSGSANSANLQELTASFDDSKLSGYLKIDDFEQLNLSFDFQVDQLNLDDYEEMESASTSSGQAESADLPVGVFRGFTGGGKFRIGTLVVAGLTATDVKTTMTANRTGVRFYPVDANFYGGKHEGDIKVDVIGDRPVLSANLGITGVQVGGLLEDMTGIARLLGQGDFFLQVQSDISNSQTSMQTLSGDIGMIILNGSVVGIDVTKMLGLVQSALGKQGDVSGQSTGDERTEFAELSMSGTIEKGVMTSNDLNMQSPLLRATGKGSFNLVEETIDYVLEPVLIGDSGVQGLDKLSGNAIPIRLSGNLYEPDYKIDVAAAILSSQKDLIEEKKNELFNKLLGGKKKKDDKKD